LFSTLWQGLLDALGAALAWIYDLVPNYGVAIIILTLVIKLLLLPLGIKQVKSMQHMQAIQPKLKELQKKYKGNKQKMQEEQMKLYKEAGVNPLGGCLPLLLQFPILIAMYSVLRPVPLVPVEPEDPVAFEVSNNHLPEDSALFETLVLHEHADFLFMDLQCSLLQVGQDNPVYYQGADDERVQLPDGAEIKGEGGTDLSFDAVTQSALDCGDSRFPDVIPYGLVLVVMVGSTFVQQRQMSRASPPGAQSQQQQLIMKIFPLMFAIFGIQFPAGLVVYWTVSNLFTIGQQTFMLRAGHIGPDAIEKRRAEQAERAKNGAKQQRDPAKGQRSGQSKGSKQNPQKGGSSKGRPSSGGKPPGRSTGRGAKPGNQLKKRPPESGP
jgi:YidC/Oxa1 family membrane protein insertase